MKDLRISGIFNNLLLRCSLIYQVITLLFLKYKN
jgi:hypothetical protein